MKKITVEVDWFSEHTIEVSDEAYDLIISEGSDFTLWPDDVLVHLNPENAHIEHFEVWDPTKAEEV